jgi:hypothetical protein
MKDNPTAHSFHIPVMGIGFTIDTPVKVAQFGISSVISLVDDSLMERMREFYCKQLNIPFIPITPKSEDHRADRITAYLNLINIIVKDKFEEVKNSVPGNNSLIDRYVELLPDNSKIRHQYEEFLKNNTADDGLIWLRKQIQPGSIDVNIMTKLDKDNYRNNIKLPVEYNDAHAAFRGFANSDLHSSIILSAGMNPRLYSYIEKFKNFYPDKNGKLEKKITLKVSDYRSASIQGKYLAKKGLWVSEYRIESGLNCGGHVFATNGHLMGPILDEFKKNREELLFTTHQLYTKALISKNIQIPAKPYEVRINAQGGVGTHREHQFLMEQYNLNSVGWGTPFLLVPEVTNVDQLTMDLLCKATSKDLILSNISPLGMPFNTLKQNTKDIEKQQYIDEGIPGSPCTKQYGELFEEFSGKALCTGSRQYQKLKLKELEEKNLDPDIHNKEYNKIVEKSCICVGLGTAALLVNDIETKSEGPGVSVCPGPNMAYFSSIISLSEMVDHIYGRSNVIKRDDRPNMFIQELKLYIDFLMNKIDESTKPWTDKQREYFDSFKNNLIDGVKYYKDMISELKSKFDDLSTSIMKDIIPLEKELSRINLNHY